MRAFASLLDGLSLAPGRNAKLALMVDHFRRVGDPGRGWALAALVGDLTLQGVRVADLRRLAGERIDPILFAISHDYVGDLSETVSLAWPARSEAAAMPGLEEIVTVLSTANRAVALHHLEMWLDRLDPVGRWALLKLITGGLRVGVSARLAKQALARFGDADIAEIEEIWHGLAPPYTALFAWLEGRADKPRPQIAAPFRPVMLAQPLFSRTQRAEAEPDAPVAITPETYAAEWKYDGVRVQAVSEGGQRRLYTRTGDEISETFPDIIAAMEFDGALDGELLVRAPEGGVAPFSALQRRLNRKRVSARDMAQRPAFIRAYDLLADGGEDLRALAFRVRRHRLEVFLSEHGGTCFDLSPLVEHVGLVDLDARRLDPPSPEIEGVMLKRWDSTYMPGRPVGAWYKWKRDPHLVDAVMMYAQRGHGRRSSFYSDFTFGVWAGGDQRAELTPVGKAYFGFTDDELQALDRFVRGHTSARYGPVRAVDAGPETGLVLEVAFDSLQASPRHKSGLAMRFPRINRIRWDKPAGEADTLATLQALLAPT